MPLNKTFKEQLINYISHAVVVCILLLAIPLESCSENISLPFSKSSAIQKIDSAQEKGSLEKDQTTLIDYSNVHIHNIPSTSTVNDLSNDSEKTDRSRNLSDPAEGIQGIRGIFEREKENNLELQKKLETKIFKINSKGYTIRFYNKNGEWVAKVINNNKEEYNLPAFLNEEEIKYLIYYVSTNTRSIQVILPTKSEGGYVYVGGALGGMKRKEPEKTSSPDREEEEDRSVPQKPNIDNKLAISNLENVATNPLPVRRSRLSLGFRREPKPKENNNSSPKLTTSTATTTSSTSDILDKKRKIEQKEKEKNVPITKAQETTPRVVSRLKLRSRTKPELGEKDNNLSSEPPTSITAMKSSTSDISDKEREIEQKEKGKKDDKKAIKSTRDLYYGDDDITEYIEAFLRHNSTYKYFQNNNYLLSLKVDGVYPIPDKQDNLEYIVAVSPAIDRAGLTARGTGGDISGINIDYWLDKNTHPKDDNEEVLENIVKFKPKSADNQSVELMQFVADLERNGRRLEFIRDILGEINDNNVENIIVRFQTELDKIKNSKRDLFDELMPFFLKQESSHAKILIPYNINEFHWLTGEICIHRKDNNYEVEIFAHDPMGGGQMEDENFEKLQSAIKKRIKDYNSQAQVTCKNKQSPYSHKRQVPGDDSSCGVIVTNELIDRITSAIQSNSYLVGVPDLRKAHIDLIKNFEPEKSFIERNRRKLQYILASKKETESSKKENEIKEKDQEKPDHKFKSPEDGEAHYQRALKYQKEKGIRKAFEYAIKAADKGSTEAKRMVSDLKEEGEHIFQEAEKLLDESIKEKKEGIFQQKIKEAITKYGNAAYLGNKPAQEKLIKLRDGSNGMKYNKVILYVIKKSESAEKSLTTLQNKYRYQSQNNQLLSKDHPLKLSDLIIMELDLQKAPQRIEWGGSLPRRSLLYKPLFEMPATEKYEDTVMSIDLAAKGSDETAYCVAKRYNDYYFILEVGGLGGDYIIDKEKRLPVLPEMLDKITRVVKKYNVKLIRVENNKDASYEIDLRRHLAENFIQARVKGYHQGAELADNIKSKKQNEKEDKTAKKKAKDIGKATRIISSLEELLKNHQIIISKNAFLDDINSVPQNNFNYKLFFQLELVKIPPDTSSGRHDDRLDATASAISYLYKKREKEKATEKGLTASNNYLGLAKFYSQKKKLTTGQTKLEYARIAYRNYKLGYKRLDTSDFKDDLDFQAPAIIRNRDMFLCECEMGWLQVKYLDKEQKGIKNLEKAVKDKFDRAEYRLAKIYLRKGNNEKGLEYLKQAAGRNAKAQYRLAKMYLREGNNEEGLRYLEKVVQKALQARDLLVKLKQDKQAKKRKQEYLDEQAFNLSKSAYKLALILFDATSSTETVSSKRR
ncbi:MAG: hypothetical protein ACYC2U_02730, partial [Candidatus Amoebophilus sp.]